MKFSVYNKANIKNNQRHIKGIRYPLITFLFNTKIFSKYTR